MRGQARDLASRAGRTNGVYGDVRMVAKATRLHGARGVVAVGWLVGAGKQEEGGAAGTMRGLQGVWGGCGSVHP